MAKEGRRRKKGMDIFSRFDIRNPEIEITPDAQQTNVLFPSQAQWNNFKVGRDKEAIKFSRKCMATAKNKYVAMQM